MGVTTTKTNKPLNPRGNDQSPLAYNRAKLYSGKALDFDGVNDYVQADGVNETLDNYTLSWNLKTTSTQSYSSIFSNSTNVIDIYIKSNGQLRFYTDQGYDSTNLPPVNDGQWKNFVLSISGTSLNIYVNGVLSETLSITDVSRSIANIRLGYIFSNLYAFNGEMAGFKIFNTALTAAQVADLYNNPEKVVPTGVDNTALKLWLPMMEGAGTTAYDGSGNGNHGTISGATYVNGISAPVAQSAVIDWNKGQNYVEHSEEIDDAYYTKTNATITADDITAPDGQSTADKINITSDSQSGVRLFKQFDAVQYTMSFYAKAGTQTDIKFYVIQQNVSAYTIDVDLVNGTLSNVPAGISDSSITDAGNGWWRITATRTFTAAASNHGYGAVVSNGNGTNFYLWGFQHKKAASIGPYIPTLATAQTSEVLLPQGLTTGRDITGVNLFENVRKQGALNLDGNSWAEVHDNGSLDFGTGSFTLEAWAKVKFVTQGSSYNAIMTLGGNLSAQGTGGFIINSSNVPVYIYSNNVTGTGSISEGTWIHMVGVYDETNATLYVNGSQVDQDARTAASITNTLVKQIGRDAASNRFYKDQIAQPRIYNRALTAEEVQRSYDSGKNIYTNS